MSFIQVVGAGGEVIATLVNYAVHPEVLGDDFGILSPDLIGPLRERIEARVGGLALFLNGAEGGMVTGENRDLDRPSDALRGLWVDARTWEECLRIGHLMADEALRIVRNAPEQPGPTLFYDAVVIRFPVESEVMWAVVTGSRLRYPHNEDHSIDARINLVNLGDAQILTIPGEAMPNIDFYLKRKMRGTHNLLLGLTNDAFGYILTEVDFRSFPRYDYVSRTSLGERTGENDCPEMNAVGVHPVRNIRLVPSGTSVGATPFRMEHAATCVAPLSRSVNSARSHRSRPSPGSVAIRTWRTSPTRSCRKRPAWLTSSTRSNT